MQDIEVGDPDFDQRWVVQASRPEAVRQFLNPAVRQALDDLSDWRKQTPPAMLGATGQVNLSLHGNRFKLRTPGFLGQSEHLIRFYELSGRVVDAFLPS
jgi:hypothetical protein